MHMRAEPRSKISDAHERNSTEKSKVSKSQEVSSLRPNVSDTWVLTTTQPIVDMGVHDKHT